MENKNGNVLNNNLLIGIIVILVIMLLGITTLSYNRVLDDGQNSTDNNEVNETDDKNENKVDSDATNNQSTSYVSLEIKDENCINSTTATYQLRNSSDNVLVSLNKDNSVTLNITKLSNWGFTNYNDYETFTINNFSKKVIDVIFGGLGQDIASSTIIFLMEDGSLEYMPVYKALQNSSVQSYGKIDGVDGIVKLYNAGALPKNSPVGGGFTILAQKADGTYYDLNSILYATGNY